MNLLISLSALPLWCTIAACTLATPLDSLQGGGGTAGNSGVAGGGGAPVAGGTTGGAAGSASEVVVSNQKGLRGIAFYKALYWVDAETPAIWTADKDGADAKPLLGAAEKVDNPYDVEASETHVFWSEFAAAELWRATGSATMSLGGGIPRAAFITMLGSAVLVSDLQGDANGKTVWRAGTRLYARRDNVMGLAHEADNVYWAETSGVFRGASDGRDPVRINMGSPSGGVATNGTDIFWIEGSTELWRQTLTSSSKQRIFVGQNGQTLFDVAASPAYVYWTDPGTNTVRRLKL